MSVVVDHDFIPDPLHVLARAGGAKRPQANGNPENPVEVGADRNDGAGSIVELKSRKRARGRRVPGRTAGLSPGRGAPGDSQQLQSKETRTPDESATIHRYQSNDGRTHELTPGPY